LKFLTHTFSPQSQIIYKGAFNVDGTPRKEKLATGFSLFVKNNFALAKANNKGSSQKEIMQQLGEMYKKSQAQHDVIDLAVFDPLYENESKISAGSI